MRTLITGGYGFAGRHLARLLVSSGDDVAVTYLQSEKALADDPLRTPLPKAIQSIQLDITDRGAVCQLMSLLQPDAIYHLAAQSFVPAGEEDLDKTFKVNFNGTINLLDAIRSHSPKTRLLYVSSAEVYGEPWPGTLPFTETSVLRPTSNYGVSKVAADMAVFKYSQRDGLDTVRVRPFPHIGPGQSDQFALSSFARQIAEIKLGRREPVVKVGNLESKRDYTDVSDIVQGYREVMLNGKRGEVYNLCSGKAVAIGELLQKLIKIAEIEVEILQDPDRVRSGDIPAVVGSADKALKEFSWKVRVDLDGTLSSLYAFWIESLSKIPLSKVA